MIIFTTLTQINYLLKDNASVLFLLAGFVLLLCYYLYAWSVVGRDPDRGVIVPHFQLPENFSPAAVRYILNMCFDKRSFTAAVVNMACKRFLDIIEEWGVYKLQRKSGDNSQLTRGERFLLKNYLIIWK